MIPVGELLHFNSYQNSIHLKENDGGKFKAFYFMYLLLYNRLYVCMRYIPSDIVAEGTHAHKSQTEQLAR